MRPLSVECRVSVLLWLCSTAECVYVPAGVVSDTAESRILSSVRIAPL